MELILSKENDKCEHGDTGVSSARVAEPLAVHFRAPSQQVTVAAQLCVSSAANACLTHSAFRLEVQHAFFFFSTRRLSKIDRNDRLVVAAFQCL